jgi:hypothetical protein
MYSAQNSKRHKTMKQMQMLTHVSCKEIIGPLHMKNAEMAHFWIWWAHTRLSAIEGILFDNRLRYFLTINNLTKPQ